MKPTKKKKALLPCEPWQVGAYSRDLRLHIFLPYPFLLLCKLWEVSPEHLITDFLDNLAHAKEKLVEYVLLSGYGKKHYSEENILQMIRELDAMGLLFPRNGGDKLLDSYVAFREDFYKHWFHHWYYQGRRQEL